MVERTELYFKLLLSETFTLGFSDSIADFLLACFSLFSFYFRSSISPSLYFFFLFRDIEKKKQILDIKMH